MKNYRKEIQGEAEYTWELETDYLDLENNLIRIPTHTPDGKPIKNIVQWISGGVDSSLTLYLMCKSIKHFGLDMTITPMTVRRPRPTNPLHAAAAIDIIEETLDIQLEHRTFYPPIDTDEQKNHADLGFFRETISDLFDRHECELVVSGITKNPPHEVQNTFRDGINQEEYNRGVNTIRHMEIWGRGKSSVPPHDPVEFYQIDPLINVDKKGVAKIYEEEGLTDTLFPVTRSCEGDSLHEHCGQCWWCEERMWAFDGRLV